MQVTNVLLEHGSPVDPADSYGQTSLHWAAKRGDAETCQLLVSVVLYKCLFFKILLLLFMCILILYGRLQNKLSHTVAVQRWFYVHTVAAFTPFITFLSTVFRLVLTPS